VLVFLLCLPFKFGWVSSLPNELAGPALAMLIMLELSSIVLCLLPVPPMDGFQALAPWLPEGMGEKLMEYSNITMLILFMVLMNSEEARGLFSAVIGRSLWLLGIDPNLVNQGWSTFRFWESE
jgi:Zn-dependent protease